MTLPQIALALLSGLLSATLVAAAFGLLPHRRPVEEGPAAEDPPPPAATPETDGEGDDTVALYKRILTDTFARLPIGLAVFDEDGRLATFNPALGDLTGLPPGFLIARPGLRDVLDSLRERRVLPEPRNWAAWREGMARLEEGARDGTLLQNWDLPDGRTWRVSGRPHPGGAMVLLIEDVSESVSSIRRLRAELELGQAVVDGLEEAIAVFSPQGVLTLSNAAYAATWDVDPARTLGHITLGEARRDWLDRMAPGALRDELSEALRSAGRARHAWLGRVRLVDGAILSIRCRPLTGGGLLVGFEPVAAEAAAEPVV